MQNKLVIDTNVAIMANGIDGKGEKVTNLACHENCESFLKDYANLEIVVDEMGFILQEYSRHLKHAGQPGMGDAFFKYVFYNQHTNKKIHRVTITPMLPIADMNFAELPPNNTVDPSDRKFLAAAVSAQADIVYAVDRGWARQKSLLEKLQIETIQLCPEHSCK
jgi:predicted nucleic acid-binding protein